ncbi:MAG: hypothetical protein GY772_15990 [bacterium]|nr:hypothetical protein [bacterium]
MLGHVPCRTDAKKRSCDSKRALGEARDCLCISGPDEGRFSSARQEGLAASDGFGIRRNQDVQATLGPKSDGAAGSSHTDALAGSRAVLLAGSRTVAPCQQPQALGKRDHAGGCMHAP